MFYSVLSATWDRPLSRVIIPLSSPSGQGFSSPFLEAPCISGLGGAEVQLLTSYLPGWNIAAKGSAGRFDIGDDIVGKRTDDLFELRFVPIQEGHPEPG